MSMAASRIPVLQPFRAGSLVFTDGRSLTRQDRADMRRVSRRWLAQMVADSYAQQPDLCFGMDNAALAINGVDVNLDVLHFQVMQGGTLRGDMSFYNIEVSEQTAPPAPRSILLRGCPAPGVSPWPGPRGRRRMLVEVLSACLDTPMVGVDGTAVDFARFDFEGDRHRQDWSERSDGEDRGGRLAGQVLSELAGQGADLVREGGLPRRITRRPRDGQPIPEFPRRRP